VIASLCMNRLLGLTPWQEVHRSYRIFASEVFLPGHT
jgi:hypothetical protein